MQSFPPPVLSRCYILRQIWKRMNENTYCIFMYDETAPSNIAAVKQLEGNVIASLLSFLWLRKVNDELTEVKYFVYMDLRATKNKVPIDLLTSHLRQNQEIVMEMQSHFALQSEEGNDSTENLDAVSDDEEGDQSTLFRGFEELLQYTRQDVEDVSYNLDQEKKTSNQQKRISFVHWLTYFHPELCTGDSWSDPSFVLEDAASLRSAPWRSSWFRRLIKLRTSLCFKDDAMEASFREYCIESNVQPIIFWSKCSIALMSAALVFLISFFVFHPTEINVLWFVALLLIFACNLVFYALILRRASLEDLDYVYVTQCIVKGLTLCHVGMQCVLCFSKFNSKSDQLSPLLLHVLQFRDIGTSALCIPSLVAVISMLIYHRMIVYVPVVEM